MKTIAISGASRGIGFGLVEQYSKDNHVRILACCRNPKNAIQLKKFSEKKPNISIHQLDVTDEKSIKNLVKELRAYSIDILINNAGIYRPHRSISDCVNLDDWISVFKTNAIGHYLVSQALVENVAGSELKMIVNVSSLLGSMTCNDMGGEYMYRSSKAGLNAITKSMAIDFMKQYSVTVIALHPGRVLTDMAGSDATLAGPNARLSITESVSSIKKVLQTITHEDNGCFFNYDGAKLAW